MSEDGAGFWELIGQAGATPPDDADTRKELLDEAEAELRKAEDEAKGE